MDSYKIAVFCLRLAGALLSVLGLVHLVATSHIVDLLSGSPPAVYARAVGPTVLNHVLVGILLLPLGYTTWLAAPHARRERWATRIIIVNTIIVFTLPLSVALFMRRPEYYSAPLFIVGVTLAGVIPLAMAFAIFVLARKSA